MANLTLSSVIDVNSNATEAIILPSLKSINVPDRPDYIGGKRANVNSFGTTDISNFSGDTSELIQMIGADFKAVKKPSFQLLDTTTTLYDAFGNPVIVPDYREVPNSYYCVNSKTGDVIGTSLTERYEIFDFDDAIYFYMGIINEIANRGFSVTPSYAKVFGNGSKMFLQHKIKGGELMGEPVDTYIALLTSHDKSAGFMLALSTVRLFCQNQINRMLKSATNKITLKHTKGNQSRIEAEATRMIALEAKNSAVLQAHLSDLANVKVSEQQIFDAFSRMYELDKMSTQRQVNNWINRMEQLMACYRMPDVDNWRGTALGAYYAASDMFQHVSPLRIPSSAERQAIRDLNNIEGAIDNADLGMFADILVSVAQ